MKKSKILYIVVISALCFLMIGQPVKAAEKKEQQTTVVRLPQNLNFYLDPGNEKGRGQIYSKQYKVQNSGKEPVTFSMEMSLSVLDPEAEIMFCPEEWSEEPEDRSIYMYALFEGEKIENRYALTDPEEICKEKIILAPAGEEGDTLYISFGGALSQSEGWKSGELAINALYKMSSAGTGYTASVEGEHIRIENEEEKLTSGEGAELVLVPDEGYSLPAKVQVFMGEVEAEASYDAATGKVVLKKVDQDVVIYANGITRAGLPDVEVMQMDETIWSWEAEKGIQAYEYSFLLEEEIVKSGRIDVKDGSVRWDWSAGLENGEYRLLLKAIGDGVYCLNSEAADYQISVNRETLQPVEEEKKPSLEEGEPEAPSEEGEEQKPEETSEEGEEQKPEESSKEGEEQESEKPSGGGETQEPEESSGEGKEREPEEMPEEGEEQSRIQPPEENGKRDIDSKLSQTSDEKEGQKTDQWSEEE